jgi:hypothetical protein
MAMAMAMVTVTATVTATAAVTPGPDTDLTDWTRGVVHGLIAIGRLVLVAQVLIITWLIAMQVSSEARQEVTDFAGLVGGGGLDEPAPAGQSHGRLALIGVQVNPSIGSSGGGWSSRGRFTTISWPPRGRRRRPGITCANWPLSSSSSSSQIGGDCGCCRAAADRY